jgi:hypothetical protein
MCKGNGVTLQITWSLYVPPVLRFKILQFSHCVLYILLISRCYLFKKYFSVCDGGTVCSLREELNFKYNLNELHAYIVY